MIFMDMGPVVDAAAILGTGIGSFIGGRIAGRTSVSQIATDTVEMLTTQVDLLKEDKRTKDAELINLRARVGVLEELVTQRAQVEELTDKVSLVRETVDRIADRVGA